MAAYFDRLRLKNVRCFRDAEIPFDKRVTVIVGENASGKTTLMEALASLAHGEGEGLHDFPLRHGAGRGEIALFENGRRSAAARWESKLASRRRLPAERHVFLYGRYRRVLLPDSPEGPRNLTDAQYRDELASHAAESRTLTLTRPDSRLLQDLPGYLRGLHFGRDSNPRLDAMWARLNAVLPQMDSSLSGIRMDRGTDALIPRIIRSGVALEIAELSHGYRDAGDRARSDAALRLSLLRRRPAGRERARRNRRNRPPPPPALAENRAATIDGPI